MPAYCFASNYAGKYMDHNAYAAKVRTMTDAELLYTARDAKAAVDANPDSPNAGYYLDEINYCSAELYRRRQACPQAVSGAGGFRLADDADALVLDAAADAYALAVDGPITPAYVAAQHADAGIPLADDELAELVSMTPDQLRDQLAYLADFQG